MYVLEDDVRPFEDQLIDDVGDSFFIARDGAGGEDDCVSLSDGDLAVDTLCHTAERRHTLSLAARRDDDCLFAGIILELVHADQRVLRNIETAQFRGRRNDIDHTAAFHHNFASVLVSGVDDLLHAVHVGSKSRDDDPRVPVILEELIDRPADRSLRRSKAGSLRICGVAQKGKNSLSSQFRKSLQIDRVAVYRRVVDFEVACVDHDAGRCIERKGCRIHDAVIGLDKLDAETSKVHGRAEAHDLSLGRLQHSPLSELVLNDAHSQPGGKNGHIDLLQHIGQRADMVLVTVRDHKSLDLIDIFFEIGRIRDHKVDSEHIVFRKRQTTVHYDNTVLTLESSYIHADLLKTAQGDDLQR